MTARYRFVCVLKAGKDYGPLYVARLFRAIERWHPGAEFVCLSDIEIPRVSLYPLVRSLPGWWSKMEMYGHPALMDGALNIYLDLDTVILGDLTPLTRYTGDLAVLADLYRPERMIGTGVVLWRGTAMLPAWEAFILDPDEIMRQHAVRMDYFLAPFFGECDRVQALWPGAVVSYKRHCRRQGGPPEGARIMNFHGKPRPRDLPADDWAAVAWRGRLETEADNLEMAA
jgi:hypothetical protein